MTGILYWAEPIDQSAEPTDRDEYVKYATSLGWSVFRPSTAFVACEIPDPSVEQANRAVLAGACALLAWLPSGVPSVGVPAEIETALELGLPVGIVTDNRRSWAVAGFAGRGAVVGNHPETVLDLLSSGTWDVQRLGFVKTTPAARLPYRSHATDVGCDLYTSEEAEIPVGAFVDVPTGVTCNLPDDVWGLVTGRSSSIRKHGLLVTSGVIDPGFRGPLFAGVLNVSQHPVTVEVDQRIAQLILIPAVFADPAWDEEVTTTDRGANGFGSSGH